MATSEAVDSSALKNDTRDDATTFAASLMEQVNREDVASMVYIQRDMLSRFEKTNEMLINFNILSANRFEVTVKDFQKHTQLLFDMKKDLDTVFKRIRVLKQRLEKNYPEAFAACSSIYTQASDSDEDGDDDDDEDSDETEVTMATTQEKYPERGDYLPDLSNPPLVTVSDLGSPTDQILGQ
ncbi:unnamed protein product [Candidula unifasciata]|uniref:KxDL domain-containing protein n=1 Tax=Candidula unifasciata TaxID=100452 RepID=A0A8S3YH96_9EUPU|nr:unnamed protein product [Candidula unifasciata]